MSIRLAGDKGHLDDQMGSERYEELVKVTPKIRGEGTYAIIERNSVRGNRATLLRSNGEILDEQVNKIIWE